MKFTEYIKESSKKELKTYGIIQSLKKDCAPFIKELRKTKQNRLIWRGSNKSSTRTIIRVTPRQDREPKDTPPEIQYELNDRFEKKYGWRPRSEGVFTSPRKTDAATYGQEYVFFPVGKYEYLYNPEVDDLYSVVDNEAAIYDAFTGEETARHEDDYEYKYGEEAEGTWSYLGSDTEEAYKDEAVAVAADAEGVDPDDPDEIIQIENNLEWIPDEELEDYISRMQEEEKEEANSILNELINGYRKTNLGLAIKKNVEIMFRCKSYYLIDQNFNTNIEDYILKDKPMKFNPKQKGLPFNRDPDWRKEGQVKQKGNPFMGLKDWQVSGVGYMPKHPKYQSLLRKSKKGYQLPNSLK